MNFARTSLDRGKQLHLGSWKGRLPRHGVDIEYVVEIIFLPMPSSMSFLPVAKFVAEKASP